LGRCAWGMSQWRVIGIPATRSADSPTFFSHASKSTVPGYGVSMTNCAKASSARSATSAVASKVEQYNRSLSASDPLATYRVALAGGDPAAGGQIFRLRTDVSCIRCHTVNGTGGIVGPVLDGVGSRQNREYLLESIVLPNAKIAQGFEGVILKLKDGRVLSGVVKKETDKDLQIVDADSHFTTVPLSDIVARQRGQSAMPEGLAQLLTKRDLRDLVEYLASLK